MTTLTAPEEGPACDSCGGETYIPERGPEYICMECEYVQWPDRDEDEGDWWYDPD